MNFSNSTEISNFWNLTFISVNVSIRLQNLMKFSEIFWSHSKKEWSKTSRTPPSFFKRPRFWLQTLVTTLTGTFFSWKFFKIFVELRLQLANGDLHSSFHHGIILLLTPAAKFSSPLNIPKNMKPSDCDVDLKGTLKRL